MRSTVPALRCGMAVLFVLVGLQGGRRRENSEERRARREEQKERRKKRRRTTVMIIRNLRLAMDKINTKGKTIKKCAIKRTHKDEKTKETTEATEKAKERGKEICASALKRRGKPPRPAPRLMMVFLVVMPTPRYDCEQADASIFILNRRKEERRARKGGETLNT